MKLMCRIQQRSLLKLCVLSALFVAHSRSEATVLDNTFTPAAGGPIFAVAVQTDGRILAGGDFTTLGGQTRNSIGRLNADGTLDTAFNPGVSGNGFAAVYSLAVQPDGKILVGGDFTTLGGQSRSSIGRLNADGTVDTSFNPGVEGDFPSVYSLALQADGKILVGGDFTSLAGQVRNYIGRLNTNGSLDTTFNPNADWIVFSTAVQADGKIVVGGIFSTLGGQARANIGRLSATGTLDTAFNPGASSDMETAVYCLALQADGKILVGGNFATLGGQSRSYIGRLNTNGTPDIFDPGASEPVESLAVQTDGKILVGGFFTTLAGQSRTHLGRVNADGSLDGPFNPVVSGGDFTSVSSLAVQPNGKVLMVGGFTNVNGQTRLNLARLENTDAATQSLTYAATTITWLRGGTSPEVVRTTFDHGSNGLAWTSLGAGTRIAGGWQKTGASVPADRTIRARGYAAGGGGNSWFVETYLGKPVFVDQPASRTNNFGTSASFQISGGGTEPLHFQWLKNGAPLADQGNITGATTRNLNLSQVANADEAGYSIVLSNAFGSITSLVATLTVDDPIITQHPQGAVRTPGGSRTFTVTAVGTPPLNYQWYRDAVAVPGATAASLNLTNLTLADAGQYTVVVGNAGGSTISQPALLTVNGVTADSTFNPGAGAAVFALAVQPDGKIVVGGAFTVMNGVGRNRLARLHPDGTLDTAFNPVANSTVYALAVQPDGKILVGGSFTTLDGLTRGRIGRLNASGTVDTTFSPIVVSLFDAFTVVECLALQADGKILLGGVFDTVAGGERINIARLSAAGTIDSFNPGSDFYDNSQPVYCLAVQPDGKILAGGGFTELGGQPRTNIGRVTSTGSSDTTFNPGANGYVNSLAVQADGRILVGGNFSVLAGQARDNIGRLNTNGTIDAAFNPGANAQVSTFAVQADGKILVGGGFTLLGGQSRNRIARLLPDGTLDGTFNPGVGNNVHALTVQPDGKILVGGNFSTLNSQFHSGIGRLHSTGPATQTLSYASSTITWLRGGTGPEVWRTTFDHSADGLTWTSLGAGTRISGGWQRTGVSLPAGRTLRASGQVVGGYHNASGWFVEGYLGKPVILSQPTSRTNGGTTTTTFQAAVGGSEPMTIQWQKNGLNLANLGNISGATSNLLTLTNLLKADEGAYRFMASNSFGSVTSLVANLTVLNPLITQHPADAHRNAGEAVTFNVAVVGTPPLSYQWNHDGAPLPGASGTSLALPNLSGGDAGSYTVTVSNPDGSVTSTPAMLTVNSATLDSSFNPQATGGYLYFGQVHALAVQADGRILLGGDFTSLGGESYNNLGRINADGTLDGTFVPDATGGDSFTSAAVYALAVQTDGMVLVGGSFDTLAGGARNNLGRLTTNGTLDSTFNPAVSGGDSFFGTYVYALAVQTDGKILLGGDFTSVAGLTRNRLARLNADGTVDTSFSPGANYPVKSLAVQPDGKILVGGEFTSLGGGTRNRIARLNPNGTLDSTFNPGASGGDRGEVHALAVQSDGRILVGGDFTTLRGQSRTNLGRLNADGTLDVAFNPGASSGIYYAYVYTLAVQSDGKILVGGDFTTLGGQPRTHLARLNADGTLDSTFSPVGGPGNVLSLTVQPDGKILVGGYFQTLAGQSRNCIAKLNNTGPYVGTLGYGGATITWLRGGTSPEIWRTTFEHSADGLAWTNLGAGTRIPGGWQKTGVSLPPIGTVRARGHVAGGDEGSGWFTESILDLTPTLRVNLLRNGNSLLLTWTGAQPPYQVQQSPNLGNPNAWINLGAPVQTNSMTLPIGAANQFLRVRTQ